MCVYRGESSTAGQVAVLGQYLLRSPRQWFSDWLLALRDSVVRVSTLGRLVTSLSLGWMSST